MRSLLSGLVLSCLLVNTAAAQQPLTTPRKPIGSGAVTTPAPTPSPNAIAAESPNITPEMREYLRELKRHDPMNPVRQAAQQKADQRRARLASMQWYGYSNLRPTANPVPFYGSYSPSWMGNSWDGYHWQSGGMPTAAIYYQDVSVYHR